LKRFKFKQGDYVQVVDDGYTYTTHLQKAVELGADVNEYCRRWYERGGNYGTLDSYKVNEGKHSWVNGMSPERGEECIVLNADQPLHLLVERTYDGRQFVIENKGLKLSKRSYDDRWFDDKDFLL